MNKDVFLQKAKKTFQPGIKGINSIHSMKKMFAGKVFILSCLITVLIVILFAFYEQQIDLIINIIDLIFIVIPTVLGLSLAGFAISISQISNESMEPLAIIQEGKDFSLYQTSNAVFSQTILAQFYCLLIAILTKIILPISIQIPVNAKLAVFVNALIMLLIAFSFIFSFLLIFDLVQNLFTTGQTANFLFMKKKIMDEENSEKK